MEIKNSIEKLYYESKFSLSRFKSRKTVLFYPELPIPMYTIYKICKCLGYNITNDPNEDYDLVFAWEDTTFRKLPYIENLSKRTGVINNECNDISKENVDKIFKEVFGYSSLINPEEHKGMCVKKGNFNGYRDGEIITCPIKPEKGYVYQKLINNENGDLIEDLRLMIIGDEIALVHKKTRLKEIRFGNSTYTADVINLDVFSDDEVRKILLVCKEIGLEYGDLDVLRDKNSKIYVIDVNTTPIGPNGKLSIKDKISTLNILSSSFKKIIGGN